MPHPGTSRRHSRFALASGGRTDLNHGFRWSQTNDGGYLPALIGLAEVGVAFAMAAAFF